MKQATIQTAIFQTHGLYLNANFQFEFWMFLGRHVGWGRFTMVRPDDEITPGGAIFELTEIRPADMKHPDPVVSCTGVLWSLREALKAEMRVPLYRDRYQVTLVSDGSVRKEALHAIDS